MKVNDASGEAKDLTMLLIEERAEWRANRTYRTGKLRVGDGRWSEGNAETAGESQRICRMKGSQRSRRTREKGI